MARSPDMVEDMAGPRRWVLRRRKVPAMSSSPPPPPPRVARAVRGLSRPGEAYTTAPRRWERRRRRTPRPGRTSDADDGPPPSDRLPARFAAAALGVGPLVRDWRCWSTCGPRRHRGRSRRRLRVGGGAAVGGSTRRPGVRSGVPAGQISPRRRRAHARRRHRVVIRPHGDDDSASSEVVLADGEVVRASATSHPAVWRLRGGGGDFGVVTDSVPLPRVGRAAGPCAHPWRGGARCRRPLADGRRARRAPVFACAPAPPQ